MSIYSNSIVNVMCALGRRVLYRYDKHTDNYGMRITPSDEHVRTELEAIGRRFVNLALPSVRCGLRDFPKLFTGGKRKVYQRAVDSLEVRALSAKDSVIRAFIKLEATKLGADPRLIQSRSARFHACLGIYIKRNEKLLYHGINRYYGETTITKGLNGEDIGELIRSKFQSFSDPVAIGLDASRFDRSVSVPLLKYMHRRYFEHMGCSFELRSLLAKQINNVGKVFCNDGKVKYKVEGGVMSGDVDTSLKGCFIMCSLVAAWLKRTGVKAKLINNGDDCVVFMERRDRERFEEGLVEWFLSLGFDIVPEKPVYELEKVEFCQAKPVLSSSGKYVQCRNPVTATVKDSLCRLNVESSVQVRQWMGAVSDCGRALAGDMPIFGALYRAYGRESQGLRAGWMTEHSGYANGLLWLSQGMSERSRVTDRTRISFWRAFGIAPHEQRLIEGYYDAWSLGESFEGPIEFLPQTSFQAPSTIRYLAHGEKRTI